LRGFILLKNLNRTVIALTMTVLAATPAVPDDDLGHRGRGGRHILLISIDGMHALDFQKCVAANTCPTLRTTFQFSGSSPELTLFPL
jgi:hypothetical protein